MYEKLITNRLPKPFCLVRCNVPILSCWTLFKALHITNCNQTRLIRMILLFPLDSFHSTLTFRTSELLNEWNKCYILLHVVRVFHSLGFLECISLRIHWLPVWNSWAHDAGELANAIPSYYLPVKKKHSLFQ